MKKVVGWVVFAALAAVFSIFAGSSPAQAGTLGCVNYSGATYLGSIVLDTSGFVIGCQQPTGANLDLIPLGSWDDWDTWFQSQYSAFITRLGFACDDCWMSASGRNGNVGIPIGFDVNRYGTTYDRVFVNSNGSLSFNHGSSSYDYPLNEILGEDPGICAYCLDLQNNTHLNQLTALATGWSLTGTTRHSDFVYRWRTTFEGRPAFVGTWINMATYSSSERAGVWNSFQIMLVDVDDSNDDVNIIVNYGSMRNENDQGYCITGSGCNHVAIGLGNVSGDVTIYNSIVDDSGLVLNGMATDQLRDGGEYALSGLHLNSEIPGRFIFHMENGSVEGSTVDAGPGCTDETAANYLSGASSDDGSCKYGVANLSANTDTNGEIVLTWDAPLTGDLDDMLFYSINYTPGGGAVTGLNTGLETHTLSNLSNATAYTINVCAVYNVNNTDVTACKQISATTNTVNTKPTFGGGGGGTYTSPTLPTTPTTPPPVVTPPAPTLPTREKSIYDRALEKGITTMSFENVRFEDTIQRYEAAKMIVNYVLNVEWKAITHNPLCLITSYSDYGRFDEEMRGYIQQICDLGFMGWNSPKSLWILPMFRPFDTLTIGEFSIVMNRYLEETNQHADSNKRIDIMNFLKEVSTR